MIILPHSTALRFNKRPYVTYSIMLLCILVYVAQLNNRNEIHQQLDNYCESIFHSDERKSPQDILSRNKYECVGSLLFLHRDAEHGAFEKISEMLDADQGYQLSEKQRKEVLTLIEKHYERFRQTVPESLDGSLMQYPDELNPIPMLTSAVAHSSWSHILFNLIFFLAFAPAVEVLINSKLRYFSVLVAISVITSLSYAFTVWVSGDDAVPTLGLSGVVMGMIGLSAYLMPHARIRVFVWFIFLVKNFYIPVWVLAAWYIGWDAWDALTSNDYGGVNLVSHVSGGVAGYLTGFFLLRNIRNERQDELEEEIEYMRAERASGSSAATYSGGRKEMQARALERQTKRDHEEYMSLLHRHVGVHRDSEAIVLILENYETQSASIEIYEALFSRIELWGASRTLVCLGRLMINLLVEHRKYARALVYVEKCQKISSEFVLADPGNVLMLARMAMENQQYDLAYLLVKDASIRYGKYLDTDQCSLLEIELLWQFLAKKEKAHLRIKELLMISEGKFKQDLVKLAMLMRE